jgi:SWI/SNF-related matrix-associated actin-dependent regulator of chromatin subfamily A member 5
MSRWAPSLKFFRLHASNTDEQLAQRKELATNATAYDVILTTYEMAKVPLLKSVYARLHFHYLVLDEGHKIKGHLTLIAQAVRNIHCGNKLILTGTPLQNNMVELWSLLNFLYPSTFTTAKPFAEGFNLAENIVDKAFLQRAQQMLDLFMLRRLKANVETFIPPKLETKVYCPLSKTQTFWYKSLLMKDLGKLAGCETAGSGKFGAQRHNMLKSLFMQLRKCCNHPFLFDGAEGDPESTSLKDLIAASGKLSVLDMLLQRLFQNKHRAVLFSQFTMVLDVLEDYCRLRGWKYCRLDGATDRARRNYYIRRFNEPNSPYFLFLVSTRSGGMGLNLQTADTCILYDSDWNPQSDIQAMGRVHRIGQTKTVHVYRLVSSGTIEERMLERAEKKLLLEMVNRESSVGTNDEDKIRGLSAAELLEDIKFGCQAVFGDAAKNELPSWDEIDIITDRTRTESDTVGKLQGNASQSAEDFDATKAFKETQIFGDTDFRKIREEQERLLKSKIPQNLYGIGYLWQEISQLNQKRERSSRIMLVEGSGSGYGALVPVLKSNNYELETGESSVFDRELKNDDKKAFGVAKKKRGPKHENQDFCQVRVVVLCGLL